MGFFVVPVAYPPSSFALLPRLACTSRNFAGTPLSPPPPRLASRIPEPLSRGPTIRHGAATQTRAGTPTERRTGADLRRTQPLPASTTRPPVLPPPPSSAKPAHSNHPPARNLQPDYRPESCRLARSHSPDPSRNPDRTLNLRCTQPLPAPTTRPPVLPPPPSSAAPAHSNHPPARNLLPDYRPESCRLAHSHSPAPTRAEPEPRPNAGLEPDLRCTQPLPVPTTRPPVLPPPSRSRTIL